MRGDLRLLRGPFNPFLALAAAGVLAGLYVVIAVGAGMRGAAAGWREFVRSVAVEADHVAGE